jgi:hypothetical protein
VPQEIELDENISFLWQSQRPVEAVFLPTIGEYVLTLGPRRKLGCGWWVNY